ncbi:MAG: VWA domain-containing protein [Chloroflexi bacterium]|nr:VWA domain-containing protein [Chloroflexota bacterium]
MEAYDSAKATLGGRLRDNDMLAWAASGLEISGKTVRSWEAAAEYFAASPEVQRQLPSGQFIRWSAVGSRLCADSPSLAVAFFKASPGSLMRLRPRYIEDWANLGRSLYRGTWKSSTLACRYYEVTPELLEQLNFVEFTRFSEFLEALSLRSYDLASQCLNDGVDLFQNLGAERESFIAVARVLADKSWRDVRGYFTASAEALPRVDAVQRGRLLTLIRKLVQLGHGNAGEGVIAGAASLSSVPADRQSRFLELSEQLLSTAPEAVPELLRQMPAIMGRVSFNQFEEWQAEGVTAVRENLDAGLSYFRLESARSQEVLDTLASGIELTRIRDLLRTYCRALVGQSIELSPTSQIVEKNIGWVEGDLPTTEGTTIYLPAVVDRFSSKESNFSWYKVVATHQVGHIEFGSFGFDFARPSTVFEDLRPHIPVPERTRAPADPGVPGVPGAPGAVLDELPAEMQEAAKERGIEGQWLTDMGRFFDAFPDRALSHDIFTVVEDSRLDARLLHEYRGIAAAYHTVQEHSLAERPAIDELPMREAMIEFIVRLSLRQRSGLKVPRDYKKVARQIAHLVDSVATHEAIVEDSAEATLRIYGLLADVPNEEIPPDEFDDIDLDDEDEEDSAPPEDAEQYLKALQGAGDSRADGTGEMPEDETEEQGEEDYESPEDVSYRGDFKPELAQLLSQMQMSAGMMDGEPGEPLTEEQLAEMLERSTEVEGEPQEGEEGDQQAQIPEELIQNLLKELARRDPQDPQSSQGPFVHVDEDGGPLEATDERSFVYDEWDFRGGEYKPRWCLVHEKDMAEGDTTFVQETLHSHASLVRDIHRQFERMVPETFRKIKRLEDGEDHDLDAVIEHFVERRSGIQPTEKLYWQRNKVERDVAVAFLLDMSASTAEAIDETGRSDDDWGAPDDPVEYMVWLRSRRAEGLRRSYKRIVDIEKEGIVLLSNALEMLGDRFGIYGFSGYGRENVEFYIIKEMDEPYTESVPRKIDRIAPLHATRMGPAIRHTTAKLRELDAKSKVLFMITDGRPQDRGYSREGVEKEYAVHDTKQALVEARRDGIVPFCLTVDKAGHDYMKTMMEDMSYEVLHDIKLLPTRLPQLYQKLTQ